MQPAKENQLRLESHIKMDELECSSFEGPIDEKVSSLLPQCPGVTSIRDRTEAVVRGFVLLMEHHDARPAVIESLLRDIRSSLNSCCNEKVWTKVLKDLLCRPMALYLRNEPPVRDEHINYVSFTGLMRRWFKNRINSFSRKNTHLWYSWLQLKRCTLEVSDNFVEDNYLDHRVALTAGDRGDDGIIEEILSVPVFQELISSLSNRVGELYNDNSNAIHNISPSHKACFEASRSNGGSFEFLKARAGICPLNEALAPSVLVRMDYFPSVLRNHVIKGQVLEYRTPARQDEWDQLFSNWQFDPVWEGDRIFCKIQAVLEPMKVRIISKGESYQYYTAKTLQRALWRALQDYPCFRLTGRPFDPTILIDLVRAFPRSHVGKDLEWLSVDYSAATDRLSWKYSSRIFDAICSKIKPADFSCLKKVLYPHSMIYPVSRNAKKLQKLTKLPIVREAHDQQSGQLMGSPLSFPILCLANLGVYLYVNRDLPLDTQGFLKSVLVNGDDMLYIGTPSTFDRHVAISKGVGLDMSVGKSYHHRVYSNVNSVSCHYDLGMRDILDNIQGTPYQIDYLNTGLFFGQHKVQGTRDSGDDESPPESCACNLEQILQGSLPGRQGPLLSAFLRLNSDKIKNELRFFLDGIPYSRNLFVSKKLGGLGLTAPQGFRYRVTNQQRYLASSLAGDVLHVTASPSPFQSVNELLLEIRQPYSSSRSGYEPPNIRSRSVKRLLTRRQLLVSNVFGWDTRVSTTV